MGSRRARSGRDVARRDAASRGSTTWPARHGPLLLVCVVIVAVALVRLRVADVPLERDEGEYAYAGQLILQGVPPYQLAYNMKFPGTYYAYAALLALFGQTPWGIHVGLLIVNAATVLVLFFLGRRVVGDLAAVVGAAAFAVLSLDRFVMGVFAHATHFVLLPALAGLLVLRRALDTRRGLDFAGAGVLLGVSVLMKQHAAVFLPLGLGLVLWHDLRRPAQPLRVVACRQGLVLAGSALPFALLCATLAGQGVLGKFWFWTFQYAREYVSEAPLSAAWPAFVFGWRSVTQATFLIWLLAGLGGVLLWVARWSGDSRMFLTALAVASFVATCPGFFFRQHYFILLLPAAGLGVGVAVASIDRLLGRVIAPATARTFAVLVFGVVVAFYVAGESRYLFTMGPRELSRALYGANPFVEAVDIARYVRERTTPREPVAVLGSEPEIYFYARRKSATGYIYTYPLMETQRYASWMQDEMIREIEAARPKYLVFVGVRTSWLPRPTSDRRIFQWAERYVQACYELVGLADIHSMDATSTWWDGAATGARPRSANLVSTFGRRSDAPCAVAR